MMSYSSMKSAVTVTVTATAGSPLANNAAVTVSVGSIAASPTSSASSSRYGSPVHHHSPTPFTPRNAEAEIPDFYHVQHVDESLRSQPADLDEDMSPTGTEPSGQEGREQGASSADPMAMRFKLPDPTLPRKHSRLP